jgi:anaerobic ribonucleoside-triphosphate reductase
MPRRRRKTGLRVLKAASSSLRMQLLLILVEKGPQSYTDLMKILKLNPSRDAGRFAYHLKYLLKADLIEPDVDNKEYRLTDLGKTMINFTEDIQQQYFQRKKIFVRTSRLAMEEFDRNKIVESLVKEANVPITQAQKIARETEKRLLEFKTKYLTAPLIREIVNAILLEKGFEEYRHKLTRLGLPVYDVNQLIKSTGTTSQSVEAIHRAAADAVMEEYTLLNVLPRDVADAHLSGGLHLKNLGSWVLKPDQFMHDLRFFLQRGMNCQGPRYLPPKTLETALFTASNILKIAATEVSGEQALDFFNIFLAPFTQGLSEERITEGLRLFVSNINQCPTKNSVDASLGLEFVIPDFLEEKEAVGPEGKTVGCYGDFVDESRRLVSILLKVMSEDDKRKPVFNPHLIVKMRPEVFKEKECASLFFESHRLAAETGLPYFANLCPREQWRASYTSSGFRLAADWRKEWELDTLQTGSMDSVIINLPRVIYEAGGKENKFFRLLDEQLEMALRALEIKYRTIKQRARENLLPFLMQKTKGDQYFRIKNAVRLVSFIGLNETVHAFLGKPLRQEGGTLNFAKRTIAYLSSDIEKYSRKPETRAALAMVPAANAAKRLAELDAEKYGWAKVRAQGTREKPVYTDLVALPLSTDISWKERLRVEENFHRLTSGGHLAVLPVPDVEQDPDDLLSYSRDVAETNGVGFYVFNRNLSYCANCQKTFIGKLERCHSCGSVNMLKTFSHI